MTKIEKILSVIIITLAVFLVVLLNSNEREKQALNNAHSLVSDSLKKQITYWKDKQGDNHASIQTTVVDSKNSEIVYKKEADKIGVKPKDIEDKTNGTSTTNFSGTFKNDTVYLTPTNKEVIKVIDNPYVFVKVKGDSLTLKVYDEWVRTSYMKRPHWYSFSKIEMEDIETKNPYVKVTNIQDYRTKKVNPILIISPTFGIGYSTDLKIHPYVGIGISYYPFSYKIY